MEYSSEWTAFLNPSIIQDIDQTYLEEGELRVIISFRATGEDDMSSIVFRKGIFDKNNDLHLMTIGKSMDIAEVSQKKFYHKGRFIEKMKEMEIPEKYSKVIQEDLTVLNFTPLILLATTRRFYQNFYLLMIFVFSEPCLYIVMVPRAKTSRFFLKK